MYIKRFIITADAHLIFLGRHIIIAVVKSKLMVPLSLVHYPLTHSSWMNYDRWHFILWNPQTTYVNSWTVYYVTQYEERMQNVTTFIIRFHFGTWNLNFKFFSFFICYFKFDYFLILLFFIFNKSFNVFILKYLNKFILSCFPL